MLMHEWVNGRGEIIRLVYAPRSVFLTGDTSGRTLEMNRTDTATDA
jgi:hypothetical protein